MLKGFSPRNLRRMRDFYRIYESSSSLMAKAQTLNWTQNTVILECCENNEQRAFYISLAAEQNLSKLALIKAIEKKTFEAVKDEKPAAQNVPNLCAIVGDADTSKTVNTAQANKTVRGAFVTACEPPHQGESATTSISSMKTTEIRGFPKRQFDLCEADTDQTARRPISSYQTDIPPFPAWADRGKPQKQFPPSILSIKNKNALPDGRTHSAFKRQPSHQMARAA